MWVWPYGFDVLGQPSGIPSKHFHALVKLPKVTRPSQLAATPKIRHPNIAARRSIHDALAGGGGGVYTQKYSIIIFLSAVV